MSGDQVRSIARQMADEVDRFGGDSAALGDLSFSLKARLAMLEQAGADHAWVEELRAFRNEIEFVYASFVESGRSGLSDDEQRQLGDVLGELREVVVQY